MCHTWPSCGLSLHRPHAPQGTSTSVPTSKRSSKLLDSEAFGSFRKLPAQTIRTHWAKLFQVRTSFWSPSVFNRNSLYAARKLVRGQASKETKTRLRDHRLSVAVSFTDCFFLTLSSLLLEASLCILFWLDDQYTSAYESYEMSIRSFARH